MRSGKIGENRRDTEMYVTCPKMTKIVQKPAHKDAKKGYCMQYKTWPAQTRRRNNDDQVLYIALMASVPSGAVYFPLGLFARGNVAPYWPTRVAGLTQENTCCL